MAVTPKKVLWIGVGVVVVVAIILAARSASEAKKLREEVANLQQQAQQGQANPEEVKKLVEEVGKLIVLPEGEEPTVATITDRERLKDVAFFDKAENEDKVLIYVNARKAYLYRPSSQKIIEVATLNLNTTNQEVSGQAVLRNGTAVAGFTRTFEEAFKQALPNVQVTGRDNAAKTDYAETIVVDLSGSKQADAQKVAAALGAKVGGLPEGESRPEGADFLVLIGNDKATGGSTSSPAANP